MIHIDYDHTKKEQIISSKFLFSYEALNNQHLLIVCNIN